MPISGALTSFVVALALALSLTPAVRVLAFRRGWMTRPSADRWAKEPTALMGGIAIAAAALGGSLTVLPHLETSHWALLGAATFMFVVGAVDDRRHLKPHTKLLAQVVAAIALVESGLHFGFGASHWLLFDQLVTILWLVGIGNAFNLLDNMDGLCAGIAAISAGVLSVIQVVEGHVATAALSAALAGAALGFLKWNFKPAKIFMGDCGSLFIGLFMAGSTLIDNTPGQSQSIVAVLALPVLVLLIPLLDTTLVTVARKWARRPLSQGGCDHCSHRLVAIGLSDRGAVLFLYTLALAGGLVGLAVRFLDWYVGQILLPVFLLGIGAVGIHLGQVRVYEDESNFGQVLDHTPIPLLAQHRYRRRMLELLIDMVSIAAGFYLAHLLRYEAAMGSPHVQAMFRTALPIVVGCHLVAYFHVGVYRGLWRHTSVSDLPRFVKGVSCGLLLTLLVLGVRGELVGMSHTVFVINWLLQLGLLTCSRLSFKILRDLLYRATGHERRPVLVVGGLGEQGELMLRRMKTDPSWGMEPTGVICEERSAVGLEIHGTPVLGTSEEIRDVLLSRPVAEAVLVDEHYSPEGWRQIRRVCAELGVGTQTIKTSLFSVDEPISVA